MNLSSVVVGASARVCGARRLRVGVAATLAVAAAAAVGVLVGWAGGSQTNLSTGLLATPMPRTAQVLGTTRFSPRDTVLFAARGRSLFVLVTTPWKKASIELVQIRPTGAVRRTRVAFDRPNALMDVSAGVYGFYGGTAVIRQLSNLRDELIRIDPKTPTIRAQATFPAAVLTVEEGTRMWATIGDGRIVRLDPRTLAIEASRRLPPRSRGGHGCRDSLEARLWPWQRLGARGQRAQAGARLA
jgi:hypothetical protein